MQPLDADKSPKVHIPPLNHIGIWVDNIENAVTELTSKGVRFAPGGIRKGAGKALTPVIFKPFSLSNVATMVKK